MNPEQEKKPAFLHNWHILEKYGKRRAYGNITGHHAHIDGTVVGTSSVENIVVDYNNGEAVITTKHTIYHCPLEYCDFDKQDEYPEIIPNYTSMKSLYKGKVTCPEIEPGKILLVLSDFNLYHFNSLCVKNNSGEKYDYVYHVNQGIVQDRVLMTLIRKNTDVPQIDISYSPILNFIEFQRIHLSGLPLFIENIGISGLEVRISGKNFSVSPNERIRIA